MTLLHSLIQRRSRARARPAQAGFLLVEVLVTMAISAFLLAALASVVSLMVRSFDKTSQAGEELETTSRLFASLSRDLSLVGRVTFAGKDAGFVFAGTRDRVVYAYDLVQDGRGETRVVDLAITTIPGGFGLERREAVFVPSSLRIENLAFGAPQSVYTGRHGLRFAYADLLPDGIEALVDEWTEPDKLPVAIRVTLTDERPGASELSLRIPLQITAESGCAEPEAETCLSSKPAEDEPDADGEPGADAVDTADQSDWRRYVQ